MSDSISSPTCPDCAAPLPPDSPQALCPACLMRQALASRTIADGDHPAPASPTLTPEELGEKFPGFEILECLGRGGMGVVYKARQKSLNRIVAIKILAPERGSESRFAERFAREAELLAKLNHPHIVTIHDFGVTDSQPSTPDSQPLYYLVMEFVDGVNLRDLLRDGKLEPQQALAIVPPICDALQYAHDKGIVHRDIKPENLLLDRDGRVKIADFGIASLMGAAGEIAGTPPYMAPEQKGGNIDHRADIYALGVVLYEMLTGERPDKELIAPSRKVQIDVRLDEVVLRALERRPELRFQQATALKTSLQIIADHASSEQPHPQMTSQPVPLAWIGYEYRSTKTLLGLPLLHVAQGLDPLTGQPRHARGIIAIGGVATGWLAMGGRAYGVIAFGGIAVGVFALGGVAVGMVSVGGLTLALVLALGGMAIAPIALGGMAIGYLAMGGQAIGVHVVDGRHQDMVWLHQSYRAYQAWLFGGLGSIWLVLLSVFACISGWAKSRALGDRNLYHTSDKNSGRRGEWALGLFIGAIAGVPVFLGFMGTQEAMVLCGLALLLSWVLGLMSWRSQSGKFAAIASGLGLLLLVAFTFKFLAPLPPQAENVPGTSSRFDPDPPTFGPVIERLVTYGVSLMLKTGTTVHEIPGRFGDSRADQNRDGPKLFLRRSGVPEIKWMLWYRNMELIRLSEVDWSKLSVPELEEKFAQEATKTAGNFANLPGLPRILEGALQEGFYGFKNSDAAGLLQVVSIADDGVKVRYKLLPVPKRKSDPPPDFASVRKRATEYAIIYYPNLEISEDGARFTMQRNLREYDVHNGSKSGDVSAETHKETGPAADGFRLVLVPLVETPVSQAFQADGPQIIDRPSWKSYVDHRFDPEKRSGVAMYFDFGPAVNEGFKDEMLGLLADMFGKQD